METKITRQVAQLQLTINEDEGRQLAAELEHYRREAGYRGATEGSMLLQLYNALIAAGWS